MQDAEFTPLTPHELTSAGHALHGLSWRSALADAFGVSEAEIIAVESGRTAAPPAWRAQLIAIAQDMALRALEAANDLLWRATSEQAASQAAFAPQLPRFA